MKTFILLILAAVPILAQNPNPCTNVNNSATSGQVLSAASAGTSPVCTWTTSSGGGGSPAGSVGDIQTKATSSTFGSITPGTGVAAALGAAVSGTGGICLASGSACAGGLSFPQTVAGTTFSGGIPYLSSATVLSASAAGTAGHLVLWGGAGAAPTDGGAPATGTVTTVGFTGGLISVANPTSTPALTVAGTSGGVPYFSSASAWASSAAGTINHVMGWGGAGNAPVDLGALPTGTVAGPGSSISGDVATFNGTGGLTIQDSGVAAGGVNAQTVSYTSLAADGGKLITMNGSSLTLTLPATPPTSVWRIDALNISASTNLTVARNSLLINGIAGNWTVYPYQMLHIWTDGSNYFAATMFPGGQSSAGDVNIGAARFLGNTFSGSGNTSVNSTGGDLNFTANHSAANDWGVRSGTANLQGLSTSPITWCPSSTFDCTPDTSLDRDAAGSVGVTNGSATTTLANYRDLRARHVFASGSQITLTSGFGTSPTLATYSRDEMWRVTNGTIAVTTGVLTFAVVYTNAPSCTAMDETLGVYLPVVPTTTTVTVTLTASAVGDVVSGTCHGAL